jgi:hypothetical protein
MKRKRELALAVHVPLIELFYEDLIDLDTNLGKLFSKWI